MRRSLAFLKLLIQVSPNEHHRSTNHKGRSHSRAFCVRNPHHLHMGLPVEAVGTVAEEVVDFRQLWKALESPVLQAHYTVHLDPVHS